MKTSLVQHLTNELTRGMPVGIFTLIMHPSFCRLWAILLVHCGLLCTAPAKNFVYKGTLTSKDIVSGATAVSNLYFVIGDEQPMAPPATNYSEVSATVVIYLKVFGEKRYLVGDSGKFRALEIHTERDGKELIVETFSQNTGQTDIEFPSIGAVLLTGVHARNGLYDTPMILTGTSLTSSGNANGELADGSATTRKFKLTLDRDLTDPIPADETLADSVQRVVQVLEDRGYIKFVP